VARQPHHRHPRQIKNPELANPAIAPTSFTTSKATSIMGQILAAT
jgi:hypothetical protein